MSNKDDRRRLYAEYCVRYAGELPVFYQSWYLDAACSDGDWDAAIYTKGGHIMGVWPYYHKRRYGLAYITMPPLTPCMGPVYHIDDGLSLSTRYAQEKEILQALHDQLPSTHLTTVYRPPGEMSSLLLRQVGYEIHRRYTYRIDLRTDDPKTGISSNQSAAIKKASDTYELRIDERCDDHLELNAATYRRQGIFCPYGDSLFRKIDSTLQQHEARTILVALDASGASRASLYLIHDQRTVYLMAIGSDDIGRSDGAIAWLIAQALERFSASHEIFDFEGSMIPRIERFFRSFGGEQVGYDHLIRTSSRWMHALLKITKRI